ncbi:SDR family oxidoreductase [Allochromatium palmeri]|uniref:NAD-dependent epimerase/dehydratase family protein n=1 Tax=Allochromatium palmeri TaxID=231048 RepID=A0A6N8E7X9_9GAMM|nr:SDR family oxidoreductase [Allochromatium palmeri]MTW19681.1 NAD-dependent epimerase/dehydratase family protein [Allochromatium palmeri]
MQDSVIAGCGYVGERLARQSLDRGESVLGLVQSQSGLERLAAAGITAARHDLAGTESMPCSLAGTRLFHLIPPPAQGREDLHTQRLIETFDQAGHPRRLVYISTTGVYGDCGGAWVDEDWPTRPTLERSLRRLDAEERLRRWSQEQGGELIVLRVAGIYGPGRLPLERLRRGLPLVRPEEAPYSNRIHVDDLVAICLAAMERGRHGAIFNVSDGHPSTMTEYFLQLAEAAGLPRPPLVTMAEASAHLSEGMMGYMSESRRLSNRRVREELGVECRYPTLTEGLAQALGEQGLHRPTME